MFKINSLYFTLPFFLGLRQPTLHSQTDLYDFPKIEDEIKVKEVKKVRRSDPFLTILSKKTEAPQNWLEKYFAAGAGRSELIRLILISKKSGKALDVITKEFEQGSSIKKIALGYTLDYSVIRKEASKILKDAEVEFELLRKKSEEAPPTAGIGERTSKELKTAQ